MILHSNFSPANTVDDSGNVTKTLMSLMLPALVSSSALSIYIRIPESCWVRPGGITGQLVSQRPLPVVALQYLGARLVKVYRFEMTTDSGPVDRKTEVVERGGVVEPNVHLRYELGLD